MSTRPNDPQSLVSAMGARLRDRRTTLGLSLSEAARRAEVSTSYMSAVESGTSAASLPVLARIARALELTIGEFLAAETETTVKRGHLDSTPGTTVVSSPALQLRVAIQNADIGESGDCPFGIEQSSVVAYVRSGKIELTVDGETWQLEEGDSLHAQEPEELAWSTPTAPARVVWAVAPATVA